MLLWAPAYLESVVPDALSSYWAYERPLAAVAIDAMKICLPIAVALYLIGRERIGQQNFAQALAAGSLGALVAALLQQKGWSYHLLPALGLASLACAAAYFRCVDGGAARWRPHAGFCLTLIAAFAAPLLFLAGVAAGERSTAQRLAAVLQEHVGAGEGIFAFITSPRDVHPAVLEVGGRWTASACCLHLLPASVRTNGPTALTGIAREPARRQLDLITQQLGRDRPKAIIIDDKPRKLGFGGERFDYLPYLSHDPRFRSLFSRYVEIQPVPGYRILVRREP